MKTLVAIEDPSEVVIELKCLVTILRAGCETYHKTLGFKGQSFRSTVYWSRRLGFWSAEAFEETTRYMLPFGAQTPSIHRTLDITLEINPAIAGNPRRCGGVFARDAEGVLQVLHSGRVAGGRPGVGMRAFLGWYRGLPRVPVKWADGKTTDAFLLGSPDDPANFLPRVAAYVHDVARFKNLVAAGQLGRAH